MKILSQKGLTLIEVAIASVVLVTALCGSLMLFNYCQEAINSAKDRAIAVRSAFSTLEQIRASQYQNILPLHGTNVFVNDLPVGVCARAVALVVGTPANPLLLAVTATVTWDEKGHNENITLTTMIASRY